MNKLGTKTEGKVSILSGPDFDKVYEYDNYVIESSSQSNDICAIYFSSSGIYYPNTEEEFRKAFIEEDRYEWYKTRLACASKHIFVRDVAKQFYITGISKKIDSIDKLLCFLKEQTKNYRIITVGSSAGAYVATIAGIELGAEMIFCFSGYFNLKVLDVDVWPYIKKYQDDIERGKWFDLHELVMAYPKDLVYFYPNCNQEDVVQSSQIMKSHRSNIHIYRCESDIHGIPISKRSLKKIFSLHFDKLVGFFGELDENIRKEDPEENTNLNKYNRVIIFGAGADGRKCLDYLRKKAYKNEIIFWDNDQEKIGTMLNGAEIVMPSRIKEANTLNIIASRKHGDEFLNQIETNQYGGRWLFMEDVICRINRSISALFMVDSFSEQIRVEKN